MKMYISLIMIVLMFTLCPCDLHAASVHIDGDRVVIISDDGTKIDTDNIKNEHPSEDGNTSIKDNGISIGSTDGVDAKGAHKTTLDNVIIINNGKTQIYKTKNDATK